MYQQLEQQTIRPTLSPEEPFLAQAPTVQTHVSAASSNEAPRMELNANNDLRTTTQRFVKLSDESSSRFEQPLYPSSISRFSSQTPDLQQQTIPAYTSVAPAYSSVAPANYNQQHHVVREHVTQQTAN